MILTNYRLKDFLLLPQQQIQEYILILQHLTPTPFLKVGFFKNKRKGVESLTQLKYKEISRLKQLLKNNTIESVIQAVELVYQIKHAKDLPIFSFYPCVNFIVKEIETIYKVEAERYARHRTKYDTIWQNAGGDELLKFSEIATLDTLAGGDILKIEQIENLPYLLVHYFLWYSTTKDNIHTKFQDLMFK